MRISDDKKIEILINLLSERYNASHKMRERSQSFSIWILGIGVAVIGLLLNGEALSIIEKRLLLVLLVFVWLLTIYYLRSIEKGFKNNRAVMIDVEKALGCYEKGFFIKSKAIFPPEYANNKKHLSIFEKLKCYLRSHFKPMYAWITIVSLIIGILIWYSSPEKTITTNQTGINSN